VEESRYERRAENRWIGRWEGERFDRCVVQIQKGTVFTEFHRLLSAIAPYEYVGSTIFVERFTERPNPSIACPLFVFIPDLLPLLRLWDTAVSGLLTIFPSLVHRSPAQRTEGLVESSKMASRPAQGKDAGVPNQKGSQAHNNRRALGDIGNIVGDVNGRCNVAKEGVNGKPVPHVTRPVTRSFGAQLLANSKATSNKGVSAMDKQSQAGAVNKQLRNSKSKDIPSPIVEEIKDDSDEDEVTIIEPIPRVKGARNRNGQVVSKKVKPQTLTATLSARSEAFCSGFDAEMTEAEELFPSIDEGDLENQLAVVEYVEDIYKFYRKIEGMSCVPDYMPSQLEINDKMRAILYDWLIEFTPSLLSAGAVHAARCTLKKEPIWNDLLKHHTGYSETDIMECVRLMVTFHENLRENKLKVVHKKDSAPKFDSVALLSPAKVPA
ncbi:hypothetical protein KI387_024732, partial [Taxus chinensis]